jgi:hypothetical protein
MSAYVDLLLLKTALGIGDDDDNALLQLAIDAASALINEWTGRSFTAETAATKYFYPDSPNVLTLTPDIRTLTSVAVDSRGDLTFATSLAATDYLLQPVQPFPDAGVYSQLVIAPNSSKAFYQGFQVKVIGDWGYTLGGVAPVAVQQACLLQASRIFKRREAPFGILQTTDLGQYTRISKADPDVEALLAPYRSAVAYGTMY